MPPTKADVIQKVHEAKNETLESGALSEQVATFIQTSKETAAADKKTLEEALATAQTRALTDDEAQDALDAATSIVDGQNTLQRVLTAAITPASEPLPPEEPGTGTGDGTEGTGEGGTPARPGARRR